MVAINFQAANYEPASNPDPIPAAWYTAFIVESDLKQAGATAKDPNGQYYAFVFEVCEGPYKGRKVFANYNVVNVNQQAVDIAYKDLASLYRAIGAEHENITNTEQLHNRPMEIKVGIQAARGDYDASNNIKSGGYRPVGAGAAAAPSAPPPVAPPAAPLVAPPAAAPAPAAPPVAAPPPAAPPAPPAAPPTAPAAPPPAAPPAAPPPVAPAPPPTTAPSPAAPAAPEPAPAAPPAAPPAAAAGIPDAPWEGQPAQ